MRFQRGSGATKASDESRLLALPLRRMLLLLPCPFCASSAPLAAAVVAVVVGVTLDVGTASSIDAPARPVPATSAPPLVEARDNITRNCVRVCDEMQRNAIDARTRATSAR